MLRELKDAVQHAAGDVATKPERADWTIDQGWQNYTPAEHAVWKTLFERQSRLLPGRACDEFVAGMRALPIDADTIPDFRRLSDVLVERTGWRVVAVPGLVPDEIFFDHLANRHFPAGSFIRSPDALLELARIDFGPLYERVRDQPEIEPGDLQPNDAVITRGTGRYHAARRGGA